jgi:hypothetical protein
VNRDLLATSAVALAILAIACTGFFVFPGHAWLASDTQIYVPMLERLYDPGVLSRDLVATRVHLGWTAYDEIALLLRRTTSLPFQQVLAIEQFVFRALAVWGLYLIAASLGLARRFAVMVAGLVSLGATIPGPALLTFEYDPVPRGFALALLLLAIGLALRGRANWAAAAGSLALLYHAPTTIPFWLVFGFLMARRRHWRPLVAPAVAAAVLVLLWRWQPGGVEWQPVLGRIGAAWEAILRLRAPYAWVSLWPRRLLWQYGLLWLVSVDAVARLGTHRDGRRKAFCLGLPAMGVLSVPISYVLLEGLKWRMAPQLQPARQVLWIALFAVLLSAVAAVAAAGRHRYPEALTWMLVVFLVPVHGDLLAPISWNRAALIFALAAVSVAAVRIGTERWRLAAVPCTAMVLAAMFAIPYLGRVRNYPDLRSPALEELCAWGKSTPRDAVFLFPDAGRSLYPGIFRAEARRALYVDWKAGGQANFFEDLAIEWWRRWQAVMSDRPDPARCRALGIDYLIVSPEHAPPGLSPAFRNAAFEAYRVP